MGEVSNKIHAPDVEATSGNFNQLQFTHWHLRIVFGTLANSAGTDEAANISHYLRPPHTKGQSSKCSIGTKMARHPTAMQPFQHELTKTTGIE